MTEKNETEMLRVILCKPGETAEAIEIEDDLESMQELVGGLIQEYMPFHSETDPRYDDVAIICNEEGKLMRLPPSRAITDEDGRVMDVIAGPFFICYAPLESERFLSMPEDLEHQFKESLNILSTFSGLMMASRQSDLTLGRRTGNRPGKDRIMSKMITGGGADDLRRRNKHCQIPPPRTLAILGGVAPKPPTVTDRV